MALVLAWTVVSTLEMRVEAADRPSAASTNFVDRFVRKVNTGLRALDEREAALVRELDRISRPDVGQQTSELGYHAVFEERVGMPATAFVEIDLGHVAPIDAIALIPAFNAGESGPAGYGFPARFRVEIGSDSLCSDCRILADESARAYPNPGIYPYLVHTPGLHARTVRVTAVEYDRQPNRLKHSVFALGELIVLSGKRNIALGRPVRSSVEPIITPPSWSPENLVDGRSVLGTPLGVEVRPTNGYHSAIKERPADSECWVMVDLGRDTSVDEVRLVPASPRDWAYTPGFGFPLRFRVELMQEPAGVDARVIFDHSGSDFARPGDNVVTIQADGARGRFVRVVATRLAQHRVYGLMTHIFSLAEIQVFSGGRNLALHGAASASDESDPRYSYWSPRFLVDDFATGKRLLDLPAWLEKLDLAHKLEVELAGVTDRRRREADRTLRTWIGSVIGAAVLMFAVFGLAFLRQRRAGKRRLERVRAQIASDLHDNIGSNLGSLALLAEVAGRSTAREEVQEDLAEIGRLARETAESMRDIVWLTSNHAPNVVDLAARLRAVATTMSADRDLVFRVTGTGDTVTLPLSVTRQIVMAFKEVLHNINKHARATRVEVDFGVVDGRLSFTVTDNGQGMDPGAQGEGAGLGLASIRARARELNGEARIDSAPGRGTTVALSVPLDRRK